MSESEDVDTQYSVLEESEHVTLTLLPLHVIQEILVSIIYLSYKLVQNISVLSCGQNVIYILVKYRNKRIHPTLSIGAPIQRCPSERPSNVTAHRAAK